MRDKRKSKSFPSVIGGLVSTAKFLLAVVLFLPVALHAQIYTYTSDGFEITITGHTGKGGSVRIPDTIDGLPVTTIADSAFSNATGLTSITIPDSVTRIGASAFSYCSGLVRATTGNGITSIEDYVFNYCNSLTNVVIGTGVTHIGKGAFTSCTSLSDITIPGNVTTIGDYAFNGCGGLTNVAFGGRVTSIGEWAFGSCGSLSSITLPYRVASIGDFSFSGCDRLTEIYFEGDAPASGGLSVFSNPGGVILYRLPAAMGWSPTWSGASALIWYPRIPAADPAFGTQNGYFGFTIKGGGDERAAVEACDDLANQDWFRVATVALSEGEAFFSDPDPASLQVRVYRLRMP